MFLLLVPALVLFIIFILASRLHQASWGWRGLILMAGLAWGSLLVLLTELLNLFQKLEPFSLALAWGIVLVLLLGLLIWLYKKARPSLPEFEQVRKDVSGWLGDQDLITWIMLAILGVQVILLAIVALSYAPNTYESVTYHLPRMMHWLQNRSLASFATSNVREVYFPPFGEYVFMHQFALTGGDRYLNLVQWGAFILSIIGVSAIAAEFGAKHNAQIATALLCAAIPFAVLQATAARNDLVLSAWMVSMVYFGLRWSKQPASWLWASATGLSLGLALLTKATGFTYAFPIGILIAILVIKNGGFLPGMVRGTFLLLLALALNLGHTSRNWELYRDPFDAQGRVRNEIMSPAVLVSNSIRNIAMHVPMDCKPPLRILNWTGRRLLTTLERLHFLSGMDPVDSRTTWGYVDIFDRSLGCIIDEHYGGNALHALLILGTCLVLPFTRFVGPVAKWFVWALLAGFLLFSLTLRWQVWGTHLQAPLFVLWTPIIALTLSRIRQPDLARIVALFALILSFVWIYQNKHRPLSDLIAGSITTREEQYFSFKSVYYPEFTAMANLIATSGCEQVGLNIDSLDYEYPFWIMLQERGFSGEIQHIDVPNETSAFEDTAFAPCAIIATDPNIKYADFPSEHTHKHLILYLDGSD